MKAFLLLACMLAGVTPLAQADSYVCEQPPLLEACAGGGGWGSDDEDCAEAPSRRYDLNFVSLLTPAAYIVVAGYAECWNDESGAGSRNGVGVWACTVACPNVHWYSSDDGPSGDVCKLEVWYQDVGCPIGPPPNPGWGHVDFLP